MLNTRSSSAEQNECLSPAELRTALGALGTADSLRLEKAGRYLGWKCQTESDELLGEAVLRALNGNRRCPKHLPVALFLIGVMKSLASEIIEKRNSDPLANRTNDDAHSPSGLLACSAPVQLDPEELLMEKQEEEYMKVLVADIESLFVDDEDARQILTSQLNGMSAMEIREQSSMSQSAYNTTRRKIRRRIDKAYPRGWNR